MDLLLILSQEHDKLPLAELRAVLEIEEIETEMEIVCPGLVILRNLDEDVFDDYYRIFVRRLGYTHEVHQLIDECDYEDLDSAVEAIDWSEYVDENFAVRVKRFNTDIDTVATERRVGHLILTSTENISVNLSDPKSFIRVVAHHSHVYLCFGKYQLNKKYFEEMKPHKRPFFHPGCMSPKLARCMANLARVKEGAVKYVDAVAGEDCVINLPEGASPALVMVEAVYDEELTAPVMEGDVVGHAVVYLADEQVDSVPLVAVEGVEKGWIFSKIGLSNMEAAIYIGVFALLVILLIWILAARAKNKRAARRKREEKIRELALKQMEQEKSQNERGWHY